MGGGGTWSTPPDVRPTGCCAIANGPAAQTRITPKATTNNRSRFDLSRIDRRTERQTGRLIKHAIVSPPCSYEAAALITNKFNPSISNFLFSLYLHRSPCSKM